VSSSSMLLTLDLPPLASEEWRLGEAGPPKRRHLGIFGVSVGLVNVLPEAKFGVVIVQPEVLKLALTHHPA
jgi:hypothetical protein